MLGRVSYLFRFSLVHLGDQSLGFLGWNGFLT